MAATNTLAYYNMTTIKAEETFIVQAQCDEIDGKSLDALSQGAPKLLVH
jgi:hypothetical protein